jgi:uncharacterized protein (DUF2236 family)
MARLLFSPDSTFWRVNREVISALAGPRAVLMQIAHPLIAAGVAEHSSFESRRLSRLYRTSLAAATITFGTEDLANRAIGAINRIHESVHGVLKAPSGPFPAGSRYSANAPDLKLWVLGTIVDSTLVVYERFVGELSERERAEYYLDSLRLARMFDIPEAMLPQSHRLFQEYMSDMMDGGSITVTDTAREIVRALFSGLTGRLLRLGSGVGIGLLPPGLRRDFGFGSDSQDIAWLRSAGRLSRRTRQFMPSVLCCSPAAILSESLVLVHALRD